VLRKRSWPSAKHNARPIKRRTKIARRVLHRRDVACWITLARRCARAAVLRTKPCERATCQSHQQRTRNRRSTCVAPLRRARECSSVASTSFKSICICFYIYLCLPLYVCMCVLHHKHMSRQRTMKRPHNTNVARQFRSSSFHQTHCVNGPSDCRECCCSTTAA
jgi:hypothetical protein